MSDDTLELAWRALPPRIASQLALDHTGCWSWTGYRNRNGYGETWNGALGCRPSRPIGSHRLVYELLIGSIPDGLEIDHLCRNTSCCNPSHLEPVTHLENMRRQVSFHKSITHCPRGHAYVADNTYVDPVGRRNCRVCRRMQDSAYKARRKASRT